MKNISKLLTVAGLAFAFATCASADVVWTLDASFTYNSLTNHATGTFQLDPSFNLVTWDLKVTGTNTQANNEYTPLDSFRPVVPSDATHFDWYDPGTNQYLNLFLQSPGVTNGGEVVNLLQGDKSSADATLVCPGCGVLTSGTVTGAPLGAVPEPRFGAFLVAGLAGLGFFARRKVVAARS